MLRQQKDKTLERRKKLLFGFTGNELKRSQRRRSVTEQRDLTTSYMSNSKSRSWKDRLIIPLNA